MSSTLPFNVLIPIDTVVKCVWIISSCWKCFHTDGEAFITAIGFIILSAVAEKLEVEYKQIYTMRILNTLYVRNFDFLNLFYLYTYPVLKVYIV